MKRFSTTNPDGTPIMGGVPFYTKDIEFIQDATAELVSCMLKGLTSSSVTIWPNFQLGQVITYASSPGEYCNYGGYVFLNGEFYYCKPTGLVGTKPYLSITNDYVFPESIRKTIAGAKEFYPWRVRQVIVQEEETEFPVENILPLHYLLFESINKDIDNLKNGTQYKDLNIKTGGEYQIPSFTNYVLVIPEDASNITLKLPQPPIKEPRKIIMRFDTENNNFVFCVKYRDKTLLSKNDNQETFHSTATFEYLHNTWLLTSKTDI